MGEKWKRISKHDHVRFALTVSYYFLILLLLFFIYGFHDASSGSYIYNEF